MIQYLFLQIQEQVENLNYSQNKLNKVLTTNI